MVTATPEATPTRVPILVRGLSKSYHDGGLEVAALRDVSLSAREGEFVCIIGPSGCGKSTLFNILSGVTDPDEGDIYIDGVDASNRLGRVGYMPQNDLLLPWRTVLDNAILGLELRGEPRAQARKRALQVMEPFGLKGFEKSYPSFLSGGMRQRAAFLRTVLADREVILLDEPFGALDAMTRANMQEWLLQLWESWRKTVIMVTHDVEEAVLLSDTVYVLTARPGTVNIVLSIELPRPRKYEIVTTEAFVSLKAKVIAAIRQGDGWLGTTNDEDGDSTWQRTRHE